MAMVSEGHDELSNNDKLRWDELSVSNCTCGSDVDSATYLQLFPIHNEQNISINMPFANHVQKISRHVHAIINYC